MMFKSSCPFKLMRGNLMIAAVILIVIVGFLATTVATMAIVGLTSASRQMDSAKAFYIAKGGLERGIYAVTSQALPCSSVTGNVNLTNISFGGGQFTVTGIGYSPSVPATLSAGITAASTVIPMSTLAGYAPMGRVRIDSESLNYAGTSTSCGGPAFCLTGARRGVEGSTAAVHALGAVVFQNQCTLTSQGAVSNLASPLAKRSVETDAIPVQVGWIVGNASGGETILGWNGSTWIRFGPYAGIPNVSLNGVSVVSSTDAWAVGNNSGGALMIRWNGTTWARVLGVGLPNQNLNDVFCVNSAVCFAVGNSGTIIQWNGSTWANSPKTGSITFTLNRLTCTSATSCWAVGNASGGETIVVWNGSTWTRSGPYASIANVSLNGVSCASPNDCWIVGNSATFAHWNGTTWSGFAVGPDITPTNMNDVFCTASNNCWGVGNTKTGDALITFWNGTSWARVTPLAASVTTQNLFRVTCAAANNCWSVGVARAMNFFAGSAWTGITPDGSVPNTTLNSVTLLNSGDVTWQVRMWREIFS
ncbi:MAG: hypothetical protein A2X77_05100 [Gammaproteobacteria bacterium GWE2_42_36]|nr:MAG: hypothetical protein A2X77_05100 [Gammaproteobacteria bacterium GWE2_42_36]HCU05671.1 hypothetical protein [Coxiellaceae bacterium]